MRRYVGSKLVSVKPKTQQSGNNYVFWLLSFVVLFIMRKTKTDCNSSVGLPPLGRDVEQAEAERFPYLACGH